MTEQNKNKQEESTRRATFKPAWGIRGQVSRFGRYHCANRKAKIARKSLKNMNRTKPRQVHSF
jgi:hypothetical protein